MLSWGHTTLAGGHSQLRDDFNTLHISVFIHENDAYHESTAFLPKFLMPIANIIVITEFKIT